MDKKGETLDNLEEDLRDILEDPKLLAPHEAVLTKNLHLMLHLHKEFIETCCQSLN